MLASLLLAAAQLPVDAPFATPNFEGASVAICVRDLDGNVLFERNSGLRVVPASNQKLLTCAFALNALGPTFRPKTLIWRTPTRTYVDSAGDPLMTYARLREAVVKLRLDRRNPVLVKETYAPGWPESWEFDDLPNKYAAPITALTVDRGSFELWAIDGRPKLLPEPFGTRIRYAKKPGELTIRYDPIRREVTVTGSLTKEKKLLDTLSIGRPDVAAATILGRSYERTDRVPETTPTGILEGNTILDTVGACLPPSDNNIAENLFLMAAQAKEPLGEKPYVIARARMTQFLTETVGWAPRDLNVMDGSGMSRHNLVTTRGITQLLLWALKQPTADTWRASLARPGTGTLSQRLAGIEFAGKTGSLNMVASLSGYLRTGSGREVVVSVVLNQYSGPATQARAAADAFIKNLVATY